jgi:AcrR family transcriptional regulator
VPAPRAVHDPPTGRRARAPRGEGERLREEILAATEKLLLDTGDEAAVSIRAIADAVGVSPPSIYLHFADKDELIRSVCQLQFRKLDEVVAEALAGVDDPREMLRGRGQAYVRFGVAHPEHYRIMLMGKGQVSAEDFEAGLMPGMRSFRSLIENVQECMDTGVFATGDPLRVATILWAAVHGMTSLLISVPCFPAFDEPESVVDEMLDTLARGLAPPAEDA